VQQPVISSISQIRRTQIRIISLAGGWLWLGGRALGALLANDTAGGLTLGLAGSVLRLVGLLRGLRGGALLLALLDGLSTGSRAGLGTLGTALLDHIERGTNDGTLRLDLATSALGGLLLSDTLSALSPAENSPCNATRVLALKEERLALTVLEAEDLAVATDEQLALYISLVSAWHPPTTMSSQAVYIQ